MNKLIQSTLSLIALLMCLHHIFVSRILSWILTLTLLFLSSASYASSPPANDVHICEILDYEDLRARDSLYAATKQTLNLNVGEPRTVRMIYFLPNDRPFRQEFVDSMKVTIRHVQTFFADQMEAHGHGRKTFRFETDAQGEPVVHRVDGQHPYDYYHSGKVQSEIDRKFDTEAKNVYLMFFTGILSVGGIGGGNKYGGYAMVKGWHWRTVAHELGHAFGLPHDWRDGDYIMSYGAGNTGRWIISACAAEFLSVHPFLNPDIPYEETGGPTIELISPNVYPTGSTSVSIRLKISDPDGLHQVLLFNRSAAGLKMCKELNGETEAIVQFDYDGVIPSFNDPYGTGTSLSNPLTHPIYVSSVDIKGNAYTSGDSPLSKSFILVDASLQGNIIATLEGHTDGVKSIAFSPVGATLASGSVDGTVKLWDVATRTNVATIAGHEGEIVSIAFSPDGTTLASVSQVVSFGRYIGRSYGPVKLWNVATRTNIATFDGSGINSVLFSPDGTVLASGSIYGTVKLWNVATRTNIATLEGHGSSVNSVSFSSDGTILASGSWDGTVKLWDVATRTNIATLEGHKGRVNSVSFSPNGTTLASGSWDGTVKLWDVATRTNIATIAGHKGGINSVSFSPDGAILASGSQDGTVKLWDTSEWLRPHPVDLVKISGDNQRGTPGATLANPLVVEVRDQYGNVFEGASVTFAVTEGEGTLSVKTAMTDANGRAQTTLTLGREQVVNIVEVKISEIKVRFVSLPESLGLILLIPTFTLKVHNPVISVSFSPDGTILAAGSHSEVKLWDVATRTNIATLKNSHVSSVSFSPDGAILASGSQDGAVKLWDVATRTNIATITGHKDGIIPVSFSPDGAILASGSQDGTVKLWDVATRTNIATIAGHKDGIRSVSFSPDGAILASGSHDGTVKLWDIGTRTNIATLAGRGGTVTSVSFSPDGAILASGSWGGAVKLWDVATRTNIATLKNSHVTSVSFSSDGTTLASGSWDGTVKLWDIGTRTNIATITGHKDGIRSVSFSPDGTVLASGSQDGTVKLWDTSEWSRPRRPVDLVKISGDNQRGTPGATLANPLVVEVRDQYGNVFEGASVTFAVTEREGTLSVKTAMTDSIGRAQTMLTLGNSLETTIVAVTVVGTDQSVTFTSEVLSPQTLVKISGDKQEGVPSALLANPLVVEVKDQNGNALEAVAVTFSVTEGEGTLSVKTAMTDSIGRAQTMLTLGNSLETTLVAVTVTGIEQPVTFVIRAIATPDFNGDGTVGISDFLLFVGQFGFSQDDAGYEARFDLDGDGMIGFEDFFIFANNFDNAGS